MDDQQTSLNETPRFRNRHGWMIAFGILELLIALAFVGMMLFIANINRLPQPATGAKMPQYVWLCISGFYGFIAAIFVAGGLGSIARQNWARILMIVVGWLWLGIGSLSTVFSFVMPVPSQAQVPLAFRLGITAFFAAIMILLPAILLIFYNSKSVRYTCLENNVSSSSPSRFPVSMIIVLILLLVAAVGQAFATVFFPFLTLFGLVIGGLAARICLGASAGIYAVLAWLFWHRDPRGWLGAFGLTVFFGISGLVTLAALSPAALYAHMPLSWFHPDKGDLSSPFLTRSFQLAVIVISQSLYLGLLWYTRRFFRRNLPVGEGLEGA